MKNLFIFFFFIAFKAFSQVSPPSILPTSAFMNYGGSVSLTASGCAGTISWSSGQTGSTVSISPKQSSKISATCTVGLETSALSNLVLIQVGLTSSPCVSNHTVSMPISGVGYRYEATNSIIGNSSVESDASLQFKAQNFVQLNAGFQAKNGSVFKAFTGKCNELQTRELSTGLVLPWEILWGPDNFIWMTEKGGKVSRVNPTTGATQLLLTINDVHVSGESGLLGMVLHPDFNDFPQVFVVYTYFENSSIKEKVVRYDYNSGNNTLTNPLILLQNIQGNTTHDGSRLVITPDLKLFITTGDAQNLSAPQSTTHLAGKILRLNLDGSIPSDNPILAGNTQPNEIWSIGHRNPQGMVFANNKLYVTSHGSNIEDEINLIQKSGNYGWPNVEGPCNLPAEITFCNTNSVIEPIFSSGNSTWAFCGLDYYNNDNYPRWKHHLLMVSLKNQTFYTFKLSEDGNTIIGQPTQYFVNQFGRLRDIAISPDGKVYICTSNGSNDKIIEITPVVD